VVRWVGVRWVGGSVGRWVGGSVGRWVGGSLGGSLGGSVGRSVGWWVARWVGGGNLFRGMEHQLEKKKSRAREARSLRANGPARPITYYHLVITMVFITVLQMEPLVLLDFMADV
jgi:hypothetical protein